MIKKKIVIFGFDGATWDIIDPLMSKGKMPNFEKLIKKGTSGKMRSFEPMASPIIWTSIASGKMPSKHGIGTLLLDSDKVRTKRIWDIFEDEGCSIGLCGHLVTWPPREIDGYIIPDDTFSKGVEAYPTELSFIRKMAEARKKGLSIREYCNYAVTCLRYGIRLRNLLKAFGTVVRLKVKNSTFLEKCHHNLSLRDALRSDLFFSLNREYDPDYSFYYTNIADACSHIYWKYHKPEDFVDVDEEKVEEFGHVVEEAYIIADRFLGRLLDIAGDDWTIGVVSDHGFRSVEISEDGWNYLIRTENLLKLLGINKKASGYNLGNTAILKFRSSYKDEMNKYIEILNQITIEETGRPLFVTFKDEYGIHLFVNKENRDFQKKHINIPGLKQCMSEDLIETSTRISGNHDLDGIFILSGPDIEKGKRIDGASVLDITPTLLALTGLAVGKDMDGKVLTEAIEDSFLAANPVKYIETYDGHLKDGEDQDDPEEYEMIRGKLKELGYLA